MHPVDLLDIRETAADLRELSLAMSKAIRLMIPAANDNNQRAQLTVLAYAARAAGDMAVQIDETVSKQ